MENPQNSIRFGKSTIHPKHPLQSKCSDLLSHSPESLIAEVTLGGTLVSLLSKLVRLAGFLDLRSNCAGAELLQHPDAILVEVQAAGRTMQALRNRDKIEREL